MALKKEDIGTSIQEYFKRTNEAAGLSSSEKKAKTTAGHQMYEITTGVSQLAQATAIMTGGVENSKLMMPEENKVSNHH